MTFKCDFGRGVTCATVIADDPPKQGESHVREIQWTGQPSNKTLLSYKAWMNSTNKMLADKWNLKLMHVYMLPKGRNELWEFEPGQRPRCVEVVYGYF